MCSYNRVRSSVQPAGLYEHAFGNAQVLQTDLKAETLTLILNLALTLPLTPHPHPHPHPHQVLQTDLKAEMGFEGWVMSDWWAVHDGGAAAAGP